MAKASITGIPTIVPPTLDTRFDPESARSSRVARRGEGRRFVAGVMTGTSLDGLDAALMEIDGHGLEMRASLVKDVSWPLGDCGVRLRRLAEQEPMTAKDIATLADDFARLHIEALSELKGRIRFDLITVHGQTVYHAPPLSWQLLNPAPIAYTLETPVIYDLRAADLACGGRGAPITPVADYIFYHHNKERRTVVNLGGFCNITKVPSGVSVKALAGGDVCACNQVLDALSRQLFHTPFDRDGQHAMRGEVKTKPGEALAELLDQQAESGRSLGTGDELTQWINHHAVVGGDDLARTACAAIAQVICKHAAPADRLVLAGGGTRNRALVAEIRARSDMPVSLSDEFGIPAGVRESAAIAVLGALCHDRVPITVPRITGVERAPIAGTWICP